MQMNLRVDDDFEQKLRQLVKLTRAPNKTAAIKAAVEEKLAQLNRQQRYDFKKVIGVAGKLASKGRFKSDDDLYTDSDS